MSEIQSYVFIGGFLINFIAAIGSYFKALGDIRHEIQRAMYDQGEKLRDEFQKQYATKEEARFIHESLLEIKISLKEIVQEVRKK